MKEVMVDLETLGRRAGCVVLSIGAVMFDPRGNGYGEKFYCNIDRVSSQQYGLTEEPETVAWWAGQSPQAKAALMTNPVTLDNALYSFSEFFNRNSATKVWCQGVSFDIPILTALYDRLGIQTPWEYWAVRDTRTVYDVCGFDQYSIKRQGTFHQATDDCIHQILCVQTAMSTRGKVIDQ